MKWSWRAGRIAGIDVYLHATFLILLGWIGLSHYLARRSVADSLDGLLFIGTLFLIVVLHELGHALAARRYGIQTRDITLLPIGGVARLERMPENPRQELVVALAGPAVNVVLALALFVGLRFAVSFGDLSNVQVVGGDFLAKLVWVNVALAVFNLLPAFPMDGGRVLRSLLALRMEYVRATQIAANIGQGLSLVFGFIGLFVNPFWVFIALFVWLGASAEASMVQMKSALGGIPIQRVMITDYRSLAPDDTLESAIEHILAGFQHDFPVVEGREVIGILTRADLLTALAQRGPETRVGAVMQRQFQTASPLDMTERVFARLQESGGHSLPVVQDGQLVGMVDTENIGEFLMIQAALRGGPALQRQAKVRT